MQIKYMVDNHQMSFEEIQEAMIKDKKVRLAIVKRIHKLFFYFYFPHYAEFEIAPFHEEMFQMTQDPKVRSAVLVAFRGSAKSTLFSMSFPLWAIMGEQKIKYVLILSKTQQKAQTLLQQIKYELETNERLRADLGPFQEERNQWNTVSLVLPKYNAKITAASAEQSIRGLRHMQYRPQLIIVDDLEDLDSVKTKEGRDKIHNWLVGDVIPAGTKHTRLFIVGNLLHEDSLIKRLQKSINSGEMDGAYRAYPILDASGNPTWLGKYPDQASIEAEKKKGITPAAWFREYMLQIIPDDDQIIKKEWLKYCEVPPNLSGTDYMGTFIGIDPASSLKETADFTAMVTASVFGRDDQIKIYIHPFPVNERLTFQESKDRAVLLAKSCGGQRPVKVIVEDVGMQKWLAQELKRAGVKAEEFKIGGVDKRTRLEVAAGPVSIGQVFFPQFGVDDLLTQLLGFGVEKHDDLVDAFSMVITHITQSQRSRCQFWTEGSGMPALNPMTPQEQAELGIRLEQEAERSQYADLMAERLRLHRADGGPKIFLF